MEKATFFADVLLPLPLPGLFTYRVPRDLEDVVAFGRRAIVPFGRSRLYSGLIIKVHQVAPQVTTKYLLDVVDDAPVISERQLQLWQWIADYYMCSLGEVMAAALPSALKLASETQVKLHPDFSGDVTVLNMHELQIVEALAHRETMTVDEVCKTVNVQKIIPIIKSLVDNKLVLKCNMFLFLFPWFAPLSIYTFFSLHNQLLGLQPLLL